MTPNDRDNLEKELAELRKRFDPARWQGQPQEIIKQFDEVGYRYEGDVGKKVRDGATSYLKSCDARLTHGEKATQALNVADGQHERRLRDLNNDEVWKDARTVIQNEHERNYQQVWRHVEGVRKEVALANGIDLEKTREGIQREAQEAARIKAGKTRERPPQELAVWDAAERRDARRGNRDYGPEM